MIKNKFYEIYNNVVKPSLLGVLSKKEQWKSYYSDSIFEHIKDIAYDEYKRINSDLHEAFNNPSRLIDRHKT